MVHRVPPAVAPSAFSDRVGIRIKQQHSESGNEGSEYVPALLVLAEQFFSVLFHENERPEVEVKRKYHEPTKE